MDTPEADYYHDLDISPSATPGEIKKAYHRLAKIHHPDKMAPGQAVDAADFRKASTYPPAPTTNNVKQPVYRSG